MTRKNKIRLGLATLIVPASVAAFVLSSEVPNLTGESFGVYASTPSGSLPPTGFAALPTDHGMASSGAGDLKVQGVLEVNFLDSNTTGAGNLDVASVQSTSSVEGIKLLGGVIEASGLVALAVSVLDGPTADSHAVGSEFAGLKVNGVSLKAVAPNTTIALPGIGSVVLNEQIKGGDGINSANLTVNMIHVRMKHPLTGASTGEIIVGSAKSAVSR